MAMPPLIAPCHEMIFHAYATLSDAISPFFIVILLLEADGH